jgi:hypothetical protein
MRRELSQAKIMVKSGLRREGWERQGGKDIFI